MNKQVEEYVIELEDKGQDALLFHVKDNIVIRTEPCQTDIWKGAYVPIINCEVGKPMPIHHPPNINYGQMNYKIVSIQAPK